MSDTRGQKRNFNQVAPSGSGQTEAENSDAKRAKVAEEKIPPGRFANRPALIRQLSVSYIDPFTQQPTYSDPRSFTGVERSARVDAVLTQLSHTGYATFFAKERTLQQRLENQQAAKASAPAQGPVAPFNPFRG